MRSIGTKLVAVTLGGAIALAHLCVCLASLPVPTRSKSIDKHACCRSSAPAEAPQTDPCKDCPAKHSIDQVAPQRAAAPDAMPLALDLCTASAADVGPSVITACPQHDTIPPPLILRDLFHSACLLTL